MKKLRIKKYRKVIRVLVTTRMLKKSKNVLLIKFINFGIKLN